MSADTEQAPAAADARGNHKRQIGVVVGDINDQTIVVAVTERYKHPQYGKFLEADRNSMRTMPKMMPTKATRCRSTETRPLSKLKRWRLESTEPRGLIAPTAWESEL